MSTRLCCFASSLLIVQPFAIRLKTYRLHRVLGWLSNAPADLLCRNVVEGISRGFNRWSDGRDGSQRRVSAQLLLFGASFGVAIASIRRGDVATHMAAMDLRLIVNPRAACLRPHSTKATNTMARFPAWPAPPSGDRDHGNTDCLRHDPSGRGSRS